MISIPENTKEAHYIASDNGNYANFVLEKF